MRSCMAWIYLSPHLDDVAFSCGGLLWEQSQAGQEIAIWTVCAGDLPEGPLTALAQSLHDRWGTGVETVARRRAEDQAAAKILGAATHWFETPDCIYRRDAQFGEALYASGASIFGAIHPAEEDLVLALAEHLRLALEDDDTLVTPLAIGNHVDHQLVRAAAESLNRPLLYYADFPYMVNNGHELGYRMPPGASGMGHPVSKKGLKQWQAAAAAYASQLSSFWLDRAAMEVAVEAHRHSMDGVQLWKSG